MPGGTPALTINEAGEATGRHRNTIRRALDAHKFPNAYRLEASGPWLIPVGDLLGAGYRVQAPEEPQRDSTGTPGTDPGEVAMLRRENSELRLRAGIAEKLASERATHIDDLRQALHALEARNPRPEDRPGPVPPAESHGEPPKQAPAIGRPGAVSRWLRRLGG